jgi:hypothetical protein
LTTKARRHDVKPAVDAPPAPAISGIPQATRQKLDKLGLRCELDLVLHLPLVPADPAWCETTATDARAIYFNAAWLETLTLAETQFVLAHEAMHCALGHFARRARKRRQNQDALPVVTTTWSLSHFPLESRLRFLHRLDQAAAGRAVAWVSAEGVGVAPAIPTLGDRRASGHSIIGLAVFDGSALRAEAIGRCWSQGRLLAWLADS